ncbi:glutathione S-transferase-like [Maniola hyperantus]|uniref:glutathione S-transferase-like n=1 Tax=Aphantopus hyperantus TaxID=2795564 RepID=UPI001567E079|nr:glutathione S-transferase-like [Maniola hyperantus]
MAKKLHYFDFNGIAESIRYILHYGKEKFEDVRYEYKYWPMKNLKESLPYGQLPLYEEGHRTINQSLAIARYVANLKNLVPSDPWEQAVLDAIVYNIYDFWHKVLAYIIEKDETRKQALKQEILEETVDYFFSRFEKELQENNGFFAGKLTWADFIFVGIVEASNLFLGAEIERKYPHTVALLNKIRSLPGVKEYIASRKPYTFKFKN